MSLESLPNELQQFLALFNYKNLTVSLQPEKQNAFVPPGTVFSNKNRVRAVGLNGHIDHEHIAPLEAALADIKKAQSTGTAVYFMVNEGDGKRSELFSDPTVLNCGKKANVHTLKALFIDTDGVPLPDLTPILTGLDLRPHAIVETSPGKYHLYFLIVPVPAEYPHVEQWEAVQKYLASLLPGLDSSMSDINQVLRLPTFLHQKDKPFTVSVRAISPIESRPLYDLAALHNKLLAEPANVSPATPVNTAPTTVAPDQPAPERTRYQFPTTTIQHPGRRKAITQYIEHILDNIIPLHAKQEEFLLLIDAFIIKYIDNPQLFLPGGQRRNNILQYLQDRKALRIAERHKRDLEQKQQLFEAHDDLLTVILPKEFILNFPGHIGLITREIHRISHISPQLSFAGAWILSGILKAETYRFSGFWPLVNGIILAAPGAGKSTLLNVLRELLKLTGVHPTRFSQLIEKQMTVQALHAKMYGAGGVGTMVIDEAGDYVKVFTAKNAPSYALMLRQYVKDATTGLSTGSTFGPGGSLSFTLPPIDNGFLSVWLAIQPEVFKSCFTTADLTDGLLARFLSFHDAPTDITKFFQDKGEIKVEPSLEFQTWVASLVADTSSRLKYPSIESLSAGTPTGTPDSKAGGESAGPSTLPAPRPNQTYFDYIASQAMDEIKTKGKPSKEALAHAGLTAVYEARRAARVMAKPITVSFEHGATGAAAAVFNAYLYDWEMKAKELQAQSAEHLALNLLLRLREMLLRLMCSASNEQGIVTEEVARAVIRFHRVQMEHALQQVTDIEAQTAPHTETVLKALRSAQNRAKGKPVGCRAIAQGINSRHKEARSRLTSILNELVQQGEVLSDLTYAKGESGRKIAVYYSASDSE
jgi:hypothetical protein